MQSSENRQRKATKKILPHLPHGRFLSELGTRKTALMPTPVHYIMYDL